jgi:ATP-binding cassette subfamily B protein
MVLAGVINAGLRKKENGVFENWMDGTVWYNRTFTFYGHELYSNIARAKDVRLYRQDITADREMQKLEEHNLKDNVSLRKMSGYKGKTAFVLGVTNALCYMYVAAKAALGAFEVGSIVQYVGALMKLIQSITELFEVVSENRIYTEHLDKLYDYLDINSEQHKDNAEGSAKLPIGNDTHQDLTIEFKDVSFKYPNTENYVLKDINAKITTGRKQAFVGANGAGKTTFVKLLCRLYDPTEGQILLNGKDIRDYEFMEYVKLFSFVFQDFKLFAFPLGQNISADLSYDKEKALECIKKVSMFDRYEKMEEGLETYLYKDISENGVSVSGGEAQKIALARALYKDAPIIVLDEPTAALDPIAEAQVYSDFNSLVDNKTAIYISHRLSSCRFCDEILVFDKGEIVQRGTHSELVNEKNGKYYELWDAQAQYYK